MIIDKIALLLLIIGGGQLGLVGIFQFDLVAWIFGGQNHSQPRDLYARGDLRPVVCFAAVPRHHRDSAHKHVASAEKAEGSPLHSCRGLPQKSILLMRIHSQEDVPVP